MQACHACARWRQRRALTRGPTAPQPFTGEKCPAWLDFAKTKCPQWLSGDAECANEPSPDVGAAICGEWSADGFDNDCFRSTVEAGISSAWAVCGAAPGSGCYESCKEYDMCSCHPTNGNCYKGNVDPKCKDVANGNTYPGQAADTWCWDGRSDSESPAGHMYCAGKGAQSAGSHPIGLACACAGLRAHATT